MTRRVKPCLRCQQPMWARTHTSYCPTCLPHTGQGHRNTYAWQQTRKQAITQWVHQHGWYCPGWQRGPHPVAEGDLTADHTIPLNRGGTDQQLGVLCASCNSRKQDRIETK